MTTEQTSQLSYRSQSRNIAVLAMSVWLTYLTAPVLYVGITQAALCDRLDASHAVANLPGSAFFWMSAIPILVAWRFHTANAIKPVLVVCFLTCAVAGILVAIALWLPTTRELRIAIVVLHGALVGGSVTTAGVFLWDVVNRGIDTSRRGLAYSLAFGIGPVFALLGSVAQQLVLNGRINVPLPSSSRLLELHAINFPSFDFPLNFAALFAASAPLMFIAALLLLLFVLPTATPERERLRQRFLSTLVGGFWEIVRDRVLLKAVLAYLVICSGWTITSNMSLFTQESLGRPAEDFAGVQNALRFGFKIVAGLLLGWLLTKTNAKMGMLATGILTFLGIAWVLLMPRQWFLIAFGLMGAGELYGVYYINYIVARSQPEQVRLNLAFISLLALLISMVPTLFGAFADQFGLPASFVAAGLVVGVSLALVLSLPAHAQPLSPQPTDPSPHQAAFQPIK